MRVRISISKILMTFLILLLVSACAQKAPKPQTMTLCDSSGCNERPKNYSSFQPEPRDTVEENKIAALEQMAATDPRAAYDLSLRFFRGDGVKQDSYRSIKWMREAAEKGDFEAQKALGRVYLTGLEEMGADFAQAQKWLSISVSRGDKEGQELLKIADEARQADLDNYEWRNQWRQNFYNNWYSGYSYRCYWSNGNWSYY